MNMIGAYWREWWPEYYIETASAVTIHQTTTAMHPDKRLLCPWSIQAFQVFWEPICAKNDSRTLWEESIQSSIKFVYTCFKSMLCRISAWLNPSVYSTNFRMNQWWQYWYPFGYVAIIHDKGLLAWTNKLNDIFGCSYICGW